VEKFENDRVCRGEGTAAGHNPRSSSDARISCGVRKLQDERWRFREFYLGKVRASVSLKPRSKDYREMMSEFITRY
jgi:hypothetical protein